MYSGLCSLNGRAHRPSQPCGYGGVGSIMEAARSRNVARAAAARGPFLLANPVTQRDFLGAFWRLSATHAPREYLSGGALFHFSATLLGSSKIIAGRSLVHC